MCLNIEIYHCKSLRHQMTHWLISSIVMTPSYGLYTLQVCLKTKLGLRTAMGFIVEIWPRQALLEDLRVQV